MHALEVEIAGYCRNNSIPVRGAAPRMTLNHLLEITVNEKARTTKVGNISIRGLEWPKVFIAIEGEYKRIWGREFDPLEFRNRLLGVHADLLKAKPNPVEWVRLEDVYRTIKSQFEKDKPDWQKKRKLVAYYKDEFSADLSKLWQAQMNKRITPPHFEFSGIRDPRLSYKVVLPDGQVTAYGHIRPLKEES